MLRLIKSKYKIALVSFAILFGELLLIRLLGTEVRIFAYVPNLILLAIFVGSGIGMMIKKTIPLYLTNIALVIILACVFSGYFKLITDVLAPISDSFIWFTSSPKTSVNIILGLLMMIFLYFIVLFSFIPLGQYLGNIFKGTNNTILDYSVNVLFSLFGTLAFSLYSFYTISPYVSILVFMVLVALLTEKKYLLYAILPILVISPIILINQITVKDTVWSQYQKLSIKELPNLELFPSGKMLSVNDVGYMGLLDLSENYQNNLPEKLTRLNVPFDIETLKYSNQYDIPYILKPNVKRVLIIGAGGGNDAAGALRAGVEHIDAVEIDQQIINFGRSLHPEKPYDDARVNIIVDDGRAFLRRTQDKYDLVIMGLADSHTLNSNLTNIQLDNYLYTKESISEVYKVLNDDGMLFVSFDVRAPWIGRRISKNFELAFGHPPLAYTMQTDAPIYGWGGVFFVNQKNHQTLLDNIESNKTLAKYLNQRRLFFTEPERFLTDDWPYLYLQNAKIPVIHLNVSILLLIALAVFIYKQKLQKEFNATAFLLGAGFLLYEFQNIGKTSLLYGNTWTTNVITISAILTLVLLANLFAAKIKIDQRIIYILLILSFLLQLAIPLSFYNQFTTLFKYAVVPFILNLPLFFGGIIFVNIFNNSEQKDKYFASNLIGSAVGGILSFLSYAFGIQSLLYISLAMYLIVLFINRKSFK